MAISEQDIRKLRRDLERDLEAVSRVEALLARRNGLRTPDTPSTDTKERGRLKQLCIEVVKSSSGVRPKDIAKTVSDRGYKFKSEQGAAASTSTVLQRLLKAKQVEKKNGLYHWKGETASDNA